MNFNGKTNTSSFKRYLCMITVMVIINLYAFGWLLRSDLSAYEKLITADILIIAAAAYMYITERIISTFGNIRE